MKSCVWLAIALIMWAVASGLHDGSCLRPVEAESPNTMAPEPTLSDDELLNRLDTGTPEEQGAAFVELRDREIVRIRRLFAIAQKHLHDPGSERRSRLAVMLLVQRGDEDVSGFLVKNVPTPLAEPCSINGSCLNTHAYAKAVLELGQASVPEII